MLIEISELNKINLVQIEILREVKRVCDILKIDFVMVHGSLLGTIRNGSFVFGDDDIDIAMDRSSYDKFVNEAPAMIKSKYFIQTTETDPNYSLEFAKVRNSNTTYVIENSKNLKMNHGIYIDVFPIDYKYKSKFKRFFYDFVLKLISLRLSNFEISNEKKIRILTKKLSIIIFPLRKKAIKFRNHIIRKVKKSEIVGLTGGKVKEKYCLKEWFNELIDMKFEGVPVKVMKGYEAYLKLIYGEYRYTTLLENKKFLNNKVEINACLYDVDIPFEKALSEKIRDKKIK